MSPILGIWASSGLGALVSASFESIATVTAPTGSITSATFSNIPSTYTHLQIRGIARTTGTGSSVSNLRIKINSDSGSNYSSHQMYGNGASVLSEAFNNGAYSWAGGVAPNTDSTALVFSGTIVDILDYKNTNKYKTIRTFSGADLNNSNGQIYFTSGLWMNTGAITSITIEINSGAGYNLAQYSHLALYGIKEAV